VVDTVRPEELVPEIEVKDGRVRILPGIFADQGGADGFFIARFRRS
jgi:16S rRNA (cytosine967-C5)-methyltransferase